MTSLTGGAGRSERPGLLAPTAGFFSALSSLLARAGKCAIVGVMAGALAGVLITILDALHDGLVLSLREPLWLALALAAFTWAATVFVLTCFARLTLRSVVWPTLVNCALTCVLLVVVCSLLSAFTWAWLIGIVIGALVGRILCLLHGLLTRKDGLSP